MERQVYQDEYGVRRTVFFDRSEPEKFTVHTEADMEQVLEEVKELSESQNRLSTNKLVARVPMTVYEQSIREEWGDKEWKRYLNSHDAAPFRVWKGRV